MKTWIFSFTLFLGLSVAALAQPTNNPYTTYYGNDASHWTNVLPWGNVIDVTTLGAIANDGQSDQQAVEQAIDAAFGQRGGVVFFPAGVYHFTNDLILKTGVVLRGENPAVSCATEPNFRPPSRLEFPRYVFDTLANNGRGNPNSSAFKIIGGVGAFRNLGIVNLDINRARIELHPNFEFLGQATHPGGTTNNYQPIDQNRNCIVMGVRSNNAAMPDPAVPDTTGPYKMRKWQRYIYRFSSNIDLFFAENVVIANNRINDEVTDNFHQPNYRVRNRCTGCTNYRNVGQPGNGGWNTENFVNVLDGKHAEFRYDAHYGITLNRHKKVILNGAQTIQAYIWYPEPAQEPALYAKGFRVMDNWLYKTDRVGLWVAGQGMELRRNVVRDSTIVGSNSTPKRMWLTPNGREILTNFSATFENRGIDFGGSQITIDSNDIQMRTYRFPESQYGSIDGEGIMDQGNGGGTRPNGIYITNNILNGDRDDCTNPTIGLYNTREAHNVVYRNNRFTGNAGCIQVQMREHVMTNILMEGNTGIKNMQFYGQGGGYNCVARNNVGAPGVMALSCYVVEENNTALVPRSQGCYVNNGGALDTTNFPGLFMVQPAADVLFPVAPATFTLKTQIQRGSVDSVVFFRDAFTKLGRATDNGNGEWEFVWTPPTLDGRYYISANAYSTVSASVLRTKSNIVLFEVNDGNPFTNNPEDIINSLSEQSAQEVAVFPNPAGSKVYVRSESPVKRMLVFDARGREMPMEWMSEQREANISALNPGVYMLLIETEKQVVKKRIVKV